MTVQSQQRLGALPPQGGGPPAVFLVQTDLRGNTDDATEAGEQRPRRPPSNAVGAGELFGPEWPDGNDSDRTDGAERSINYTVAARRKQQRQPSRVGDCQRLSMQLVTGGQLWAGNRRQGAP